MAVLVNGTPTEFFSTFKGLRQEDPLSPYLFVLIMEAFSYLISRAKEKGLKINLQKSEIILVGEVEDVDRAVVVFGCKVGNLPTTYLGLPLGAPHNSCRVWDVIEERFKRKLATWKKQYLSKGGRLTLIKSTLSNLPIYFMSLFVIPRRVRLRLEKIQREFLWGELEERRKIHLGSWAVICKDKRHGGKGEFLEEVIVGKFGEKEGGWTTREVRESYGMGLWKDIRKGWEEFFPRTSIRIGNGRHTRFWWDFWVGDSKLKDLFPLLYRIATHNSAVVADLWGRQ
ncbi:putative ribonuclease H protein [Vitis vinifera]|uniref:Putative ribonuclease H protein n=1 Tax=Vitis vinifera TaxID=29760 RepID=A0A438IT21_VITVI|nr:putative ribonuclease H protein [Vitis vinifera]